MIFWSLCSSTLPYRFEASPQTESTRILQKVLLFMAVGRSSRSSIPESPCSWFVKVRTWAPTCSSNIPLKMLCLEYSCASAWISTENESVGRYLEVSDGKYNKLIGHYGISFVILSKLTSGFLQYQTYLQRRNETLISPFSKTIQTLLSVDSLANKRSPDVVWLEFSFLYSVI